MKRILITGGEGFVGGYLLRALAGVPGAGEVIRASRLPGRGRADEVFLDLLDERSVVRAVVETRPDVVIHLAAQSSVAGSLNSTALTWEVNREGSVRLARAIAGTTPHATVLFVSSAEVYGSYFNFGTADENSPPSPLSPYAESKLAAEQAFRDILPSSARLIIARPGNHTGAGQSTDFVVPSLAHQIAKIEVGLQPSLLVGDLNSRRDFLDVADVVDAYLALLSAASTLPPVVIVNIASGESLRIGDILARLVTMARVPIEVKVDPARLRPSEVPDARIAADRMRSLGWAPIVPLQATLTSVLQGERCRCSAPQADSLPN